MITRRVVVNLVAFAVVSLALIGYGVFDLLGDPFASSTTVSTVLPTTAGLAPNFSVFYDGIDVGSVSSVSLVKGGAKVTMTINPGTHVPADVAARVIIGNALGEQEVELVPRPYSTTAGSSAATAAGSTSPGSGSAAGAARDTAVARPAPLRNGEVLPVAPDNAPASVGTLVAEATRILDAIPAGDLNNLLHEAAVALNGQADNLRTIAQASATFAQEFLSYQGQFQALLANAPPVLNTVAADASVLQQGLAETATVLNVLTQHGGDYASLLKQGSVATTDLNTLVVANRANLGCLTHDLAATATNLTEPTNLTDLTAALQGNGGFFSIVQAVAPAGPARALTSRDTARTNQVQLRVHILLPPQQPPGTQYTSPKGLTTIRPGAACDTEFGKGVGAVQQPGFTPADGGTVSPPTAAEAQVRGGGPVTPTPGGTAAADARLPRQTGALWPLLVVAALAVLAAAAAAGRRPVRAAAAGHDGGQRTTAAGSGEGAGRGRLVSARHSTRHSRRRQGVGGNPEMPR